MKQLGFFLLVGALALCAAYAPSSAAQAGRRTTTTTDSTQKTYPLDLPAAPAQTAAGEDDGELFQCVEETRQTPAKSPGAQANDAAQSNGGAQTNGSGQADGGAQASQPAQTDETFRGTEVTTKAVIEKKPNPVPTEEARRRGTSGTVRLRAVLGAQGRVTTVKVLKPLPDGLTYSAVKAACAIRFKPATKDGRPVAQYVILEYGFRIDTRGYPRMGPIYPTGPRWP